ncbi:histidine kinase [Paenibacillus tritici]|uniref:sensor histidine kinase n=1 Tax=Paenibacillus tritici TaxID=1873425 RepID=UPI001BA61E46|nr:histidine kinase [Paenibacillus tritici]QUL53459.1 histidine kinase [Paenibacillus tritici]
MGLRFPKISWNSIRLKLIVGLVLITVPLITLLIYNNYYSIAVVRNQVAISNKNLISLYMAQIDSQLEEAESNVLSLANNNWDIKSLDLPNSEDDYQMAKYNLSTTLTNNMVFYKSVDAFFVYNYVRQDLVDAFQSVVLYPEQMKVEEVLKKYLDGFTNSSAAADKNWFIQKIDQSYYILRIVRSGNLYIGAWVNTRTLLQPMQLIDLGDEGSVILVTSKGKTLSSTRSLKDENIDLTRGFQQYYVSGTKNNLLVVGESSEKGDFSLAAIIPNKHILQNLPWLTNVNTIVSFAAIGLLPLGLLFLFRILLMPLKRLIIVMKRINKGLVHTRIEDYQTSDEFILVNQTFNTMMSEIESLKINVYEEQLNKQKAELQHLQLQINPHFFLNSLNILYNLAQVKNYELIQEMTLCLVRYFRFMFRSNLSFVSLDEELQHVRNYIRIQELRFPEHLTCTISVPEFLEKLSVPPLLIQTFLENSIKHSVTLEEPIHLSVQLDLREDGLEPYIEIVIRDTGKGFSEEVLTEINSGNRIIDDQGEHIGIWNVRKRLKFLYGNSASITCYNGYPNGAVIEIKLPYTEEG